MGEQGALHFFCLNSVTLGVMVKIDFPRLHSKEGMYLVRLKNQRILDVLRIIISVKISFLHQKWKRLTVGVGYSQLLLAS